ncbi:MAG: SCO family protein [Anaerolineales bacterium]
MMKKLRSSVLFLLLICLLIACQNEPHVFNGSPYQDPNPAPPIPLTDTSGIPFQLEDYHGKIVLLYFGYTFCPDVCPSTLASVRQILDELGDSSQEVVFVMITVDPDRDSPEILDEYLSRFHPGYIGLWGDGEELENVKQAYGVFSEIDPESDPLNYLVSHTARIFLIDQEGILRTGYSFGTPNGKILSDVEHLIGSES